MKEKVLLYFEHVVDSGDGVFTNQELTQEIYACSTINRNLFRSSHFFYEDTEATTLTFVAPTRELLEKPYDLTRVDWRGKAWRVTSVSRAGNELIISLGEEMTNDTAIIQY